MESLADEGDRGRVLVVGQTTRDLVLHVDRAPADGESVAARARRESVGGKGANQALALARLGRRVRLVSAVGDDDAGSALLDELARDGVDVGGVARREAATGLVVELLDDDGARFVLDLPPADQLGPEAVQAEDLDGVDAVLVQLAEPVDAALAAARRGRGAGALVVLDGAPTASDPGRDRLPELLALADVVRADAEEAGVLAGRPLADLDDVRAAAHALVAGDGPLRVAILEAGADGNVVARREDGHVETVTVPLEEPTAGVLDATGAGDVLVATLVHRLLAGDAPVTAVRAAARGAAASLEHLGGRPPRPGPEVPPAGDLGT